MSHERFLAIGENPKEEAFISEARMAGLGVYQSSPIECGEPVKDRYGKIAKICTVPDCIIVDHRLKAYVYVEVTGEKDTRHKEAQRRVVEAADVSNYIVISDSEINKLRSLSHRSQKLDYLHKLFGWSNLT